MALCGSAAPFLCRRRTNIRLAIVLETATTLGALRPNSSYPDTALGREVAYRVRRFPLGMERMYGAGLSSALLGIGSGVLKIPAMDTVLRLPLKVSSATSHIMIGETAAASAYF